jgi:phospholipid/cholesterol/gamma-HCH transport system ATP-binding protein
MNANGKNLVARMEGIWLSFGEREVLKDCSFDVIRGAITCIIGLSGAGKSTILRVLDGLIRPDKGHVFVLGEDFCHLKEEKLNEIRERIGFSFQFAALLDSLTIGENVALPLEEHTKMTRAEIRNTVLDALESVGLSDVYDSLPAELSGGMLKRAGFARAVVTRPELVLYDEPTTGLDPIVSNLITETILKLREKLNGTAVVISHDLPSIFKMADYVAMLYDGAIIAYDRTDHIRNSTNPIVQQFLQGSEVGPIPILSEGLESNG